LEAIVALPLNLFYNTGIATYVWVCTNRKPEHRRGKVQLLDATGWFEPLRKNLGKKNRKLSEADIARICDAFLAFEETEESRIFDNAAFGYWKVTVERPLRTAGADPNRAYKPAEIKRLKDDGERDENAPPVIRKILKRGTEGEPLRGRFEATVDGRRAVVEYEPDSDLRDTEQIPLLEEGGIEAFLQREVLPYTPDAWYRTEAVKIGYEISFNRYFYKPQPMRTLAEIGADILALERQTEGLLDGLMVAEPRAPYGKRRIYVDTSVIGGCEEEEFREASRRLIERVVRGEFVLAVSPVVLEELERAPARVRAVLDNLPTKHTEELEVSGAARALARRYIERGALTNRMSADALHIATATVARVDALVSWNFQRIVNLWRIEAFDAVSREMGYRPVRILSPRGLPDEA
ncbi:MAG: N-6 DNA methylase, partial [Acidobacteria bacterium]|nr:N-6 DNA methylase [Acidobacteriota bacterium]